MNHNTEVNPFAAPALEANDGLDVEEGVRFELAAKDLRRACARCSMQVHTVFGSLTMFAVGLAFVVSLAIVVVQTRNPFSWFSVWGLAFGVAFGIQSWISRPIRGRLEQNSLRDPALRPGNKRIAFDVVAGTLQVDFEQEQRLFQLSELSIKSEGDPSMGNRSTNQGMSSIVLEVANEHILVIPGQAFHSPRGYRDFLKSLKTAIRQEKQAMFTANHAER